MKDTIRQVLLMLGGSKDYKKSNTWSLSLTMIKKSIPEFLTDDMNLTDEAKEKLKNGTLTSVVKSKVYQHLHARALKEDHDVHIMLPLSFFK